MSDVVAIACADVHLSHTAPQARAAEPSWYEAMRRPLAEIAGLSTKHNAAVLCAGDIFHRWNSPAELINFAAGQMREWYAIPGQHDLAYHSLADIRRTSYWTLTETKTIDHLPESQGIPTLMEIPDDTPPRDSCLWGFPWNVDVRPPTEDESERADDCLKIALIHAYIWANKATAYPGAPPTSAVPAWKDRLRGYDLAIFGDNHKPFEARAGGCRVYNCGGLMRRHADEIGHRPSVGLIHADGTITRHYLDCSEDKFTDEAQRAGELLRGDDPGMSDFIAELGDLGPESLDFASAVRRYIEETRPPQAVAKLLLEAIE